MAYDTNVAKTAYSVAKGMGADYKVVLALFEAGIVESGMRNINYGDRDSVGFLQQRPSQGWPNPMDVPTATRSFVSRAMHNEKPGQTPGQLAQSVQISAFPGRYDAVANNAILLIKQIGGAVTDLNGLPNGQATTPGGGGLLGIGDLVKIFTTLANPKTWARIIEFLIGAALVVLGIFFIASKNETVQAAAKDAAGLAMLVAK